LRGLDQFGEAAIEARILAVVRRLDFLSADPQPLAAFAQYQRAAIVSTVMSQVWGTGLQEVEIGAHRRIGAVHHRDHRRERGIAVGRKIRAPRK